MIHPEQPDSDEPLDMRRGAKTSLGLSAIAAYLNLVGPVGYMMEEIRNSQHVAPPADDVVQLPPEESR